MKGEPYTWEQRQLIFRLRAVEGKPWEEIAAQVPSRSAQSVKNRFFRDREARTFGTAPKMPMARGYRPIQVGPTFLDEQHHELHQLIYCQNRKKPQHVTGE